MKTYCKSCGNENVYIGQKPKFCQECGESLMAKVITPQKTYRTQVTYQNEEERETNFDPNRFDIKAMVEDFKNSDAVKSIKKQLNKERKGVKLNFDENGKINEYDEE